MSRKTAHAAMLALAVAARLRGQVPDPTAGDPPTDPGRVVSWTKLVPNVASDQKQIWTFPTKLGKRKYWVPAASIVGVTAGLVALDPKTAGYFRRSSSFDGLNNVLTGHATDMGSIVAPLSLYAAGLLRKDSKMQSTALLAGEAIANAEILTTAMKDIDRRLRPADIAPHGDFSDSWFQDNKRYLRSNGSFPSGHTIAAFSIATVVARRYGKQHRWIPYVAYGTAAAVGFSRMTLSSHFPSDVFMGAALGYSISRFTVLRE
jgi:membrane-associated phospholipid phosphatase